MTNDRFDDRAKVADASLSLLSPRLGVTLATGEPSGDESALINSLFIVQTEIPIRRYVTGL
jgi:hypothetical protein